MGDRDTEASSDATEPVRGRDGRGTSRWKVVLLVLSALVVLGSILLAWGMSRLGDPPPPIGLPIDNRTDAELLVYGVVRQGGTDSEVTD